MSSWKQGCHDVVRGSDFFLSGDVLKYFILTKSYGKDVSINILLEKRKNDEMLNNSGNL